jgi:hypothetical protein
MGTLNGTVLGEPSGKVGKVVIRKWNGKLVTYRLPENIKVSQTELSIASRKRITPMSKFASTICSIEELKAVWQATRSVKALSAYHKVEKANKGRFDLLRPKAEAVIVPYGGFQSKLISAGLSIDEIRIVIQVEKEYLGFSELINGVNVLFIVCFYDPVKSGGEYFEFCNIRTHVEEWKTNEPLEIKFIMPPEGKNIFTMYKKSILYYTIIPFESNGNILGYSVSQSREFENVSDSNGNSLENKQSADIQEMDYAI